MTNVERAFIHQLAQKNCGIWASPKFVELDQNILDKMQNSELISRFRSSPKIFGPYLIIFGPGTYLFICILYVGGKILFTINRLLECPSN